MKKSAETVVEEYFITEILKGTLPPNTMLKPERELTEQLGFSRPVIHKALIRLEGQGLVTILPRRGIRVNDYRLSGKLVLLERIFDLYRVGIDQRLSQSMLRFIRQNFFSIMSLVQELDFSKKQALYKTQSDRLIETGEAVFQWMHTYALGCENLVYPMLINEFRTGILNVGDVILGGQGRTSFIQLLKDLNDFMLTKDTGMELRVRTLFEFIEHNWLEGSEELA